MIEHDYYKLLELESFSDIGTVRKRYRQLALMYHPDRNPGNQSVEEFFKIITQGYNILSDKDLKADYDRALKAYLNGEAPPEPSVYSSFGNRSGKAEDIRKKMERNRENRRLAVIMDYEDREAVFSHRYRFLTGCLLFLSGIVISYNNWFINYHDFKVLLIVVGSFMFGTGAYFMADNRYRMKTYQLAMADSGDFLKVSGPVRTFAMLFVLTPLIFLGIVRFSKYLQLKYCYSYVKIDNLSYQERNFNYEYSVGDKKILRITEEVPGIKIKDRLRVKYSLINPVVSEVVVLDEVEAQLNEILK